MNIDISLRGPISLVTGPKITLDLPKGSKISDILEVLRGNYVAKAREIGLEEVFLNLKSQNLILVDGKEISALHGKETDVDASSEIYLVNFTHGG